MGKKWVPIPNTISADGDEGQMGDYRTTAGLSQLGVPATTVFSVDILVLIFSIVCKKHTDSTYGPRSYLHGSKILVQPSIYKISNLEDCGALSACHHERPMPLRILPNLFQPWYNQPQ